MDRRRNQEQGINGAMRVILRCLRRLYRNAGQAPFWTFFEIKELPDDEHQNKNHLRFNPSGDCGCGDPATHYRVYSHICYPPEATLVSGSRKGSLFLGIKNGAFRNRRARNRYPLTQPIFILYGSATCPWSVLSKIPLFGKIRFIKARSKKSTAC